MTPNPAWIIATARLKLAPVTPVDRPDLRALKSDPRAFGLMLGGVRSWARTDEELAEDIRFWGAHGCGIWSVRAAGVFIGITGFVQRPDARGIALRFAFWPETRGRGLAREAAGAALAFGHAHAKLARIIAVARETNIASRIVLGGIGMVHVDTFEQAGQRMLLFESVRITRSRSPGGATHPEGPVRCRGASR